MAFTRRLAMLGCCPVDHILGQTGCDGMRLIEEVGNGTPFDEVIAPFLSLDGQIAAGQVETC